jgi:hypothetical protein
MTLARYAYSFFFGLGYVRLETPIFANDGHDRIAQKAHNIRFAEGVYELLDNVLYDG